MFWLKITIRWLWLEETEDQAQKFSMHMNRRWDGESQINLKETKKSLSNTLHDSCSITFFFLVLVSNKPLAVIAEDKFLHAPEHSLKNTYLWRGDECSKPAITIFIWFILNQVDGYIDAARQIQQNLPYVQ